MGKAFIICDVLFRIIWAPKASLLIIQSLLHRPKIFIDCFDLRHSLVLHLGRVPMIIWPVNSFLTRMPSMTKQYLSNENWKITTALSLVWSRVFLVWSKGDSNMNTHRDLFKNNISLGIGCMRVTKTDFVGTCKRS